MGMLLTMGDYTKPLPTVEEVVVEPKIEDKVGTVEIVKDKKKSNKKIGK